MTKNFTNQPLVLWFTGLSGSGKTTIANKLKEHYEKLGLRVNILDGDEFRKTHTSNLGYSEKDVLKNNKLIAETCAEIMSAFDIVVISVISPLNEGRVLARSIIGKDIFRLIYFSAPFDVVSLRDVKGHYKKAMQVGNRPMIGSKEGLSYDVPSDHNLELNSSPTHGSVDTTFRTLVDYIESQLVISRRVDF